jgi:hypothetical protein
MRLVLRILGADIVEVATGKDAASEEPDAPPAQRGVAGAADLTPSDLSFGFGAASPNDEPLVDE